MSQYIYNVNAVYLSHNTSMYAGTNIRSIDLQYTPFVNNNMSQAFESCKNLVEVKNINNDVNKMFWTFQKCQKLTNIPAKIPDSVTNMTGTFNCCSVLKDPPALPNNIVDLQETFAYCRNLVNTPIIPNSVKYMGYTFKNCERLTQAPEIPEGVIQMGATFAGCYNITTGPVIPRSVTQLYDAFGDSGLTKAPLIPNNVTGMNYTFSGCTNLGGNIFITAENITNAYDCFKWRAERRNVYIPFKYANGVNTKTYNAFKAAGYNENGITTAPNTSNNIYLMDINIPINVTVHLDAVLGRGYFNIYTIQNITENTASQGSYNVTSTLMYSNVAVNSGSLLGANYILPATFKIGQDCSVGILWEPPHGISGTRIRWTPNTCTNIIRTVTGNYPLDYYQIFGTSHLYSVINFTISDFDPVLKLYAYDAQ